ncbi:NACHT domain-containing protein [Streptomyces sp. NPDC055189]
MQVVGSWFWLLYVAGALGALILVWRSESTVATTAAALLLALPGAYLGWQTFRHDRAEAASPGDLGAVADRLAIAVRKQADAEAALRRVEDPYPLPVAWRAADAHLVERWDALAAVAHAWPGGPPGDPGLWPADAAGLSGVGADIGEVYVRRVPTRRLVILGAPGSGKSVLLLRLVHELVERRRPGGPVPIVLSLASWDPVARSLAEWVADQLRLSNPGLAASAPGNVTGSGLDLAQALWDERLILPLLDGFDELPPALHSVALNTLNRSLPAKHPVVLASRTAEFDAALAQTQRLVLNSAAGICLLPVDRDAAAAYLRRDAGDQHSSAVARWDRVTAQLGTATPVGQALATPLGLFLARTIYNPCHASTPGPARHPDSLCDTITFPTRRALNDHLFSAFISAAYTTDSGERPHWTDEQAERALIFLAGHLRIQHGGAPDLAWWQLSALVPTGTRHLAVALTLGLISTPVFGIGVAFILGPVGALVGAPLGGVLMGLEVWGGLRYAARYATPRAQVPHRRLLWAFTWGKLLIGISCGLSFGLLAWLTAGLGTGLTYWLGTALLVGIAVGLHTEDVDLNTAVTPSAVLAQDRRVFLCLCTVVIVMVGLPLGLVSGLLGGPAVGLIFGLTYGLMGGAAGFATSAWPVFLFTRAYLAVRGHLPWRVMAFLNDACQRGVLRQIGAVYQFRHIDLQRHLAVRY